MAAVRRHARRKGVQAVDRFATDYPELVTAWGGRGMLESRETVAALVKMLDPATGASKLGGFFRRLFGG